MSVLIKGVEMPTNCFLCPLSVLNENRLFCEVTKNEVLRAKIDAECPLVPVPPHGRLIDADVVARDLQEMSEDIEKSFPYLDKNDALMIERGIQFARQYVLNLAPTIIPAEEGEK